ncbi:MAG: 30S ribosomal protein S6 [Spirochaetales bacterium]|nr:30S ribosomal protein S6 [Spirochaetales bacterium]
MKYYELTVILKKDEEDFKKGLELVKNTLDKIEAKILKEEDLGVRDLAYLIKKEKKAHYYYFEVDALPESINTVNKVFNLSTDVLKYLYIAAEQN